MTDEAQLLARCIALDEAAWREFLARYRAILYGSILKTLEMRGEPAEGADDIFQDVLLKLLADDCRALRRFEGRSQTSTWLARIAINATIDAIRRRRARREDLEPAEEDERSPTAAEEILKHIPVDARILEGMASRDLAQRLLERLDERDCLILKLYFFAALKEREIADLLEIPLNTLSSQKARALGKLRSAARELLRVSSHGAEPGEEPGEASEPEGA